MTSDEAIYERAKDRNGEKEPDELHLAYEREMTRLRVEVDWLLAEADDATRAKFRRLQSHDQLGPHGCDGRCANLT